VDQKTKDRHAPDASNWRYVVFRQESFRQHIQSGDGMFKDAAAAKLSIFVTLCKILCDARVSNVDSVHQYAAIYVIRHLKDIEIEIEETESVSKTPKDKFKKEILSTNKHFKEERAKDKQKKPKFSRISDENLGNVASALYKLLSNETGASSVFERIQSLIPGSQISFDLYNFPEDTSSKHEPNGREAHTTKSTTTLISNWAKELYTRIQEQENHPSLPPQILEWAKCLTEQPQTMPKSLAKGHLRSWAQKTTIEEARTPYPIAHSLPYVHSNNALPPSLLSYVLAF
jgi:hypothetical protein